jgi:hypothetical protein
VAVVVEGKRDQSQESGVRSQEKNGIAALRKFSTCKCDEGDAFFPCETELRSPSPCPSPQGGEGTHSALSIIDGTNAASYAALSSQKNLTGMLRVIWKDN